MRAIAIAVIAKDSANGISYKGNIPWPSLRQSAELIESRTKDQIVIMGRKTWDSIPKGSKPLPNRLNYVISRKLTTLSIVREYGSGVVVFSSLEDAMLSALAHNSEKKIFIIGGGELFKEALSKNLISNIILTDVQNKFDADMFFKFPTHFEKLETTEMFSQEIPGTATKNSPNESIRYQISVFRIYQNSEEIEYLNLLVSLIKNGTRGKIGDKDVIKIFGSQLTFNTENSFPRFTTRKIPVKGVFLEILWMLRGDTNINFLRENKIYIHDKYATEDAHKKNGFDYKPGEIGHCEGYQWRNFGGDQLVNVINKLKVSRDSADENIIVSWNPVDLSKMAIKPKTIALQFNVNTRLDCRVILNDVDMITQFPQMVSGYSFLLLLMAKMTNLRPGRITFQIGLSYIQESHRTSAEFEIERTPYPFPLVGIRRDLTLEDLNTFDVDEDIVWENYVYHEGLAYPTNTATSTSNLSKNPIVADAQKNEELPESLKKGADHDHALNITSKSKTSNNSPNKQLPKNTSKQSGKNTPAKNTSNKTEMVDSGSTNSGSTNSGSTNSETKTSTINQVKDIESPEPIESDIDLLNPSTLLIS